MRLLICAQAVDANDLALGFFVKWISEFARRYDHVQVIALSRGENSLPSNVTVHSLGKENGPKNRLAYALATLALAWKLRGEYDAVFVHQSEEYVLVAGFLWKMLGKRVYLWRNHYAGSVLTRLAVALSSKVFCTSKHSFTRRFKKTSLMPVGVDIDAFTNVSANRTPRAILFFARFAPSKRPDALIEALGILKQRGISFSASIVGSPLPADIAYKEEVMRRARELGLSSVAFCDGVPHEKAPDVFAAHEIFVNLGPSGMYDKTIFEGAASGCLVAAASDDFAKLSGISAVSAQPERLADALNVLLDLPAGEKARRARLMRSLAERHSLGALVAQLREQMA